MYRLEIDDVDVDVVKRMLLREAVDLEDAQGRVEVDEGDRTHICEVSQRLLRYAHQMTLEEYRPRELG